MASLLLYMSWFWLSKIMKLGVKCVSISATWPTIRYDLTAYGIIPECSWSCSIQPWKESEQPQSGFERTCFPTVFTAILHPSLLILCIKDKSLLKFSQPLMTMVEWKVEGENLSRLLGGTRAPVPLCLPQVPYEPPWEWTCASMVTIRKLAVWGTAQPRRAQIRLRECLAFCWFAFPTHQQCILEIQGHNQKFPDWVDNEINNNKIKQPLKSSIKSCGGKTH